MGGFNIINDISKRVTLVQFVDMVENVNNEMSISGNWIFYSNYEKSILLGK